MKLNFFIIIFFNNTFFLRHKSTRLLAHYQLNIIKVVFYSPVTHHCSSNWNFKSTQKYHQRSPRRRSSGFDCQKWLWGAAVCSDRKQGGRRASLCSCPWDQHVPGSRGAGTVWWAPTPAPDPRGSGKGSGPPWGGWQKRGLWAQVIILKAFPHIQ